MNTVDLILKLYDDTWSHAWESINAALHEITEEEAAWQDPAYRDEEQQPGFPPPGSVLWHLSHIEYWTRSNLEILRKRPIESYPKVEPSSATTLSELIAAMNQTRDDVHDEIAKLTPEDLETICLRDRTLAETIGIAIRHQSWHAGEIAMARRLYREGQRRVASL